MMYSLCRTELLLTSIKGVSTLSDQEVKPIMYRKRVEHGNQRGKEQEEKEGGTGKGHREGGSRRRESRRNRGRKKRRKTQGK